MLPATAATHPPVTLDSFERELWSRLLPRLALLVHVDQEDVPAACLFVRAVASYLRLTRTLRTRDGVATGSGEFDVHEAKREATHWRLAARAAAADFGLLPTNRVRLALVDATGEDIELKRLFGLDITR